MELRSVPKHLSAGPPPTTTISHSASTSRTHTPTPSTTYPSHRYNEFDEYNEKQSLEYIEQPPISLDEDEGVSPIEEVRVTVSSEYFCFVPIPFFVVCLYRTFFFICLYWIFFPKSTTDQRNLGQTPLLFVVVSRPIQLTPFSPLFPYPHPPSTLISQYRQRWPKFTL